MKGNRFTKGISGNPNGRPRKIQSVLKDHFLNSHNLKLSSSQVTDILLGILSKTHSEIVELRENKELPFWICLVANKALLDYEKGSLDLIEKILDRTYGKPRQSIEIPERDNKIEVSFKFKDPEPENLTPDERLAMIERLREEIRKENQ